MTLEAVKSNVIQWNIENQTALMRFLINEITNEKAIQYQSKRIDLSN